MSQHTVVCVWGGRWVKKRKSGFTGTRLQQRWRVFAISVGIELRHSSWRKQVLVWLCVDHYQSAVWVKGSTLTLCYHVLPFVGACTGEDVLQRQHYCSCLPLIPALPSPPLPLGADYKHGRIALVFRGDLWSQR